MREERVDILSESSLKRFDAICFTSNGIVKSNGELVMGAGVARAFRDRFPGLSLLAGRAVRMHGNVCQVVFTDRKLDLVPVIVAFPTKNHWKDPSPLKLIVQSAEQLMQMVEHNHWREVALPRPGCANGGLDWNEVKPTLEPIFDDRIVICTL